MSSLYALQCARRLPTFLLGSSRTPLEAYLPNINFCRRPLSDKTRPPRNDEILSIHPIVQLVNPKTNKLDPPQAFREIYDLYTKELKHNYIELVSSDPPVVRIYNKREVNDARKAHKAKLREKPKNELKEIQVTWGVNSGDLDHKLKKVRVELERGNRVHMVFAPKAKQPLPAVQEMQKLLDTVADKLGDVAKEPRHRTFEKNVAVLHLSSSAPRADKSS